jgi:hypothetical protein
MVRGDHSPVVSGEIDDGAEGVEGEEAPCRLTRVADLVSSGEADQAIGAVVVLGELLAGLVVLGEE